MRDFFINKNVCFKYRLGKHIGRKKATKICNATEKLILLLGRPHYHRTA